MVYFRIVEKKPFWYFFFKAWLRQVFNHAYYRRVYVSGKANLPEKGGPFMMVSNHQNGLLDALAILFSMPLRYPVVFLARADVFKKKTAAKILNFCKIMPVYRQRDGRETLGGNAAIFDEAAKLAGSGYPVTLFPEGKHQEGHWLGQVKKGFARIAFDAAERNGFPENMVIVPVGNHYSDYFVKRAELCVNFGEPIRLSRYYALYKENPPKAMTALAEEVRASIQGLMLDIPDTEHYADYDFLREVVRTGHRRRLPESLAADRRFADNLRRMVEKSGIERGVSDQSVGSRVEGNPEDPERIEACRWLEALRQKAGTYRDALHALRVGTSEVENVPTLPELTGRLFLLLLGLPLALYGMLFTGLPVWMGRRKSAGIAARIKNKMLRSSFDFVITQLIFTGLSYMVYIVAYWVAVSCMSVEAGLAWGVFALLLASWMLTRAFWQDYLRYACRSFRRFRAFGRKKQCRALQPLRAELCAMTRS